MITTFRTKYGANVPLELFAEYFKKMINKIYKLLPLYEEGVGTLTVYIQYLLIEVNAGHDLILEDVNFLELLINLEVLSHVDLEHKIYKGQVFKCIKICEGIVENLQKGDGINGV